MIVLPISNLPNIVCLDSISIPWFDLSILHGCQPFRKNRRENAWNWTFSKFASNGSEISFQITYKGVGGKSFNSNI